MNWYLIKSLWNFLRLRIILYKTLYSRVFDSNLHFKRVIFLAYQIILGSCVVIIFKVSIVIKWFQEKGALSEVAMCMLLSHSRTLFYYCHLNAKYRFPSAFRTTDHSSSPLSQASGSFLVCILRDFCTKHFSLCEDWRREKTFSFAGRTRSLSSRTRTQGRKIINRKIRRVCFAKYLLFSIYLKVMSYLSHVSN